MRILYIVSSLRRSGPIVVLKDIIMNLGISMKQIEIIKLCADEPQRSITHEFKELGVKIHEFNFSKLQLELRTRYCAKIINKCVNEIKPSIIHSHGYQAALICSTLKSDVKLVATLHCIAEEDFVMDKGKILGNYMCNRFYKALNRFNSLGAISKGVLDAHLPKLNKTNGVRLIYNGVALNSPNRKLVDKIKKEYNIKEGEIIFIVIASLSPRKDPICVIDAFKKAFNKNEKARLFFLGKGVLMEECRDRIGDDDRITLVGWTPNVAEFIDIADYSITASHSEGFGLNFIESLSAGKLTISSDIKVFDEFKELYPILNDFSFKCGSSEDLANILYKAYKSEKPNLSEVQQDVNERFSAKTMGRKYMEIYTELSVDN